MNTTTWRDFLAAGSVGDRLGPSLACYYAIAYCSPGPALWQSAWPGSKGMPGALLRTALSVSPIQVLVVKQNISIKSCGMTIPMSEDPRKQPWGPHGSGTSHVDAGRESMQLHNVSHIDELAICNDGSPGAYYHRPGIGDGATRRVTCMHRLCTAQSAWPWVPYCPRATLQAMLCMQVPEQAIGSMASSLLLNKICLRDGRSTPICSRTRIHAGYLGLVHACSWVIRFLGGAWCWDGPSCAARNVSQPYLMTTVLLPPSTSADAHAPNHEVLYQLFAQQPLSIMYNAV